MKRALFLVLLFLPVIAICSDGICNVTESRTNCPKDCCLTHSDNICEWYSECGNYDPDCCASGTCYSSQYLCSGNQRGSNCYPGRCLSGSCDNSCMSFNDCPSGFCGTECSELCIENGNPAADFGSCCECHSGGLCQPCSTLSVMGAGFFVYQERLTSFPIQLYGSTVTVTNVSIAVSGPLKDYITLNSNDRLWKDDGFGYIGPGESKVFYATLGSIPEDVSGMYQLKFSIKYNSGSTSHLMWVAVLPVNVMEQGRSPPSKGNVGISRSIMGMAYGNTTVPVEVIMQVW